MVVHITTVHFQTKIHKCARVKTITKNIYPLLRTVWRLVSNLLQYYDGGSLTFENPWIIELFIENCVVIFTATVIVTVKFCSNLNLHGGGCLIDD